MESELWTELQKVLRELGRLYRSHHVQYTDMAVVRAFLWSVLHERPRYWGCDPRNWPAAQRPATLPSPSTISRRLWRPGVHALLEAMERQLRDRWPHSCLKILDALPLPVGGATHDPDAGYGLAAGGTKAHGYKLHVALDPQRGIEAWDIEPMQINEKTVAPQLIYQLDSEGYLSTDGEYDSNRLFETAHDVGYQMIAPPRKGAAGLGHRRHSPFRLRCHDLLGKPLGQALLAARDAIERFFGQWCTFSGGLAPLPRWVRRMRRVWRWVQAKIILHAIYRSLKTRLRT